MIRKRRCLGFRVRSSWICFVMILCLAAMLILYRRLSHSTSHQHTDLNYVPFEDSQAYRESFRQSLEESNLVLHGKLKNKNMLGAHLGNELSHDRNLKNYKLDSDKLVEIVKFLYQLYPTDWGTALDPSEMAVDLKHFLADLDINSEITCQDVDTISSTTAVANPKKKFVELTSIDNREVIVKSQNFDEETRFMCSKTAEENDNCEFMGNYKLMREILYLSILKHPQIINMLGFCLRSGTITTDIRKKGIVLVTEKASSRNSGNLPFMRWEKRLKYAKQLASLLLYLQFSPIGSLGLDKFSADDIVLGEGNHQVKLVDLDEIRFTEKPCTTAYHCLIDDQQFGIKCVDKKCLNFNAKLNLYHVGKKLLDPLLRNNPQEVSKEIKTLLDKLAFLKITAEEIYNILDNIKKDEDDDFHAPNQRADKETEHFQQRNFGGSRNVPEGNFHAHETNDLPNDDHANNKPLDDHHIDNKLPDDHHVENKPLDVHNVENIPDEKIWDAGYLRHDEANYPGMYDYLCPGSRVTWGCVMTVNGLKQAIETCNVDPECKSFVLFTSLPETVGADYGVLLPGLVTAVFKNDYSIRPEKNVGATLFVKKKKRIYAEKHVREKYLTLAPVVQTDNPPVIKANTSVKMSKEECLQKVKFKSQDARIVRERRLMTHLGLKGIKEREWLASISVQKVFKNRGFYPNTPSPLSRGAKFFVDFNRPKPKEIKYVKRALFSAAQGPHYYHVAQLISYHLDRLLGLYHIPPTVYKQISRKEIANFKIDDTWDKFIDPVKEKDGSLKGIVTVPLPKVMKPDKLTIPKLSEMVSKPTIFNKTERIQVEYVFVWWITKLFNQKNMFYNYKESLQINFCSDCMKHLGSKLKLFESSCCLQPDPHELIRAICALNCKHQPRLGYLSQCHFVHFNSDRAFQDVSNDLIGYFYHCQFPNIVYKALLCLKCSATNNQPGPVVCSLGKEVFKILVNEGINTNDINIAGNSGSDIIMLIDDAATLVVSIVERCIKKFGREAVLY